MVSFVAMSQNLIRERNGYQMCARLPHASCHMPHASLSLGLSLTRNVANVFVVIGDDALFYLPHLSVATTKGRGGGRKREQLTGAAEYFMKHLLLNNPVELILTNN